MRARFAFKDVLRRRRTWLLAILLLVVAAPVTYTLVATDWPDVIDRQLGESPKLGESYRLYAPYHKEELCVAFRKGNDYEILIAPVVVDAGYDERYIVASTRWPDNPGGTLSYYYVDVPGETSAIRQRVTGPLTQEEFETAKEELDLPDFGLHYPELR